MEKKFSTSNVLFGGTAEKPVEEEPSLLTITPRTIHLGYGSEVFQIKNLTRIGKYKIFKKQFPIRLIIILGFVGFIFLILSWLVMLQGAGLFFSFGSLFLSIAGYGVWKRMGLPRHAFCFETNSGTVRYIYVKSSKHNYFIDEIVRAVTRYIESEQTSSMVINIEDRSITNTGIIGGNAQSGDNSNGNQN
uniref:Uncharacterized protein n=1 Tax=Candidatus Kentrum sp. SD TaxID=2126332 RepID=A0A450YRC7_9GAMM|nr:MAG: hypothetical protein BECKSD772F_GA0070984_11651 [Candidatus Kentron sp. SD]VFK49859.1 MAG: hypothetical protein BECKSD772E_GA0070983_12611 [Candidatus Kentron sp. SD]